MRNDDGRHSGHAQLEVIVSSVEDAMEAERGGASRVEVVRELHRGGLTPPVSLVGDILDAVSIPVRVMLRESDGFGIDGADEVDRLEAAARALARLPIDGVVVGWIASDAAPDLALTSRILACAPNHRATFHHAFEALRDQLAGIDALKTLRQVDRILAHGGDGDWSVKLARLERDQHRAAPEITLLVGRGLTLEVARLLAARPLLREAHAGRAVRDPPTRAGRVSAQRVAMLCRALNGK